MHKTGFRTLAVVVAFVTAGAGYAGAESLAEQFSADGSVFEHNIDADTAKNDDKQQIESIRFEQFPKSADKGEQNADTLAIDFEITVKFRSEDKPSQAAGMCFASEEQMDCRIDCDGSGFFLKADEAEGSRSIVLINTDGFQLNGCSDDNGKVQTVKPDLENNAYRLDPLN